MKDTVLKPRILAIDASRWAIRAVLTDPFCHELLDSCEAKPEQSPRIVRFVARHLTPETWVIGAHQDCWPYDLEQFLRQSNARVERLPSYPLQPVSWQLAPWHKKLRLHRARLLAYLSENGRDLRHQGVARVALDWQRHIHQEALEEARAGLRSLPEPQSEHSPWFG